MSLLNEIIKTYGSQILLSILSLLSVYAIYGLGKLLSYGKLKAQGIKDENTRKLVLSTIEKVEGLTRRSIIATENTTKKEIIEGINSGIYTKDKLSELSIKVKDEVLSQLTTDSKETLKSEINDIDKYILNLIETQIAEMKNQGKLVSTDLLINPTDKESKLTDGTLDENGLTVNNGSITINDKEVNPTVVGSIMNDDIINGINTLKTEVESLKNSINTESNNQ